MKPQITLTICLILIFGMSSAEAQEYRHNFGNSPELAIEFTLAQGGITIEGHDSEELVIRNLDYEAPPERADGLRALYNSAVDNSGIGLSVTEENGILEIIPVARGSGEYTLLVPHRVRLKIEEVNFFGSGDIEIQNHRGEIEVLSRSGDISLINVTGPVIANNTSGDVVVEFTELSQENPTSISISSGFIDITLPADSRADFQLSSFSGEIYTDLDITLVNATSQNSDEDGETSQESPEAYSAEELYRALRGLNPQPSVGAIQIPRPIQWPNTPGRQIEGTLNGGGIEVSLKTLSGNIYLRREE